jgi:hypothetical protein
LRKVEIVKICQEILNKSGLFESENDKKSQCFEKSQQEVCKNPLTSQSRSKQTVEK